VGTYAGSFPSTSFDLTDFAARKTESVSLGQLNQPGHVVDVPLEYLVPAGQKVAVEIKGNNVHLGGSGMLQPPEAKGYFDTNDAAHCVVDSGIRVSTGTFIITVTGHE
jgi:hypothetical protein